MAPPADGNRLIVLFGGASIQVGGEPIGGRATHRHPLALLAILIAAAGRPLSRDKLIALLWPERDGESARNLLKVAVHELRKELGDASIRSAGDQLTADLTQLSCDVAEFHSAIQRGDHAQACALYTGPFLDGFFLKDAAEFERWADAERLRLAALYGSALSRLAQDAEDRGDTEASLRWRRAHSTHDPYHPDVAHRLIAALAASGDRAGAIRSAEAFAQRQRDDLGITDEHELVRRARELTSSYIAPSVVRAAPVTVAHPAGAPTAVAPTQRRFALPIAAVVVVAVIAGALALTAPFARSANRAATSLSANAIAIVPLGSAGTDSTARDAFADLLATRFAGDDDASLHTVDTRTVLAARRKAQAGRSALSLDGALALAHSLGATRLLTSEVVSGGDSVAATAHFYQVATGRLLVSARADGSTGTSLARLADRVVIEILARNAGEPDENLSGLLRRPIGAAKAFVAAQVAYRSARYADAERLYGRALDADTTFGAAGLGLAMANSWTTISENYGKGRTAALAHQREMSARDRLFAEAFFGSDPSLGPAKPAPVHLERWEDLVEKYPDWPEAWYQLGDRYYHYGRLSGLADATERARHAFRTALDRDSLFAAPLHHLVEIYAALGQRPELRATGERYFAVTPGVNRDRSAVGWEIASALGDDAWLSRLRANFASMPREELTRIAWVTDLNGWPSSDAERAVVLVDHTAGTASEHEKAAITAFTLHVNRGQLDAAHADAAALGRQFPDRPVAALWEFYLAAFGSGDTAAASKAVQSLAAFARSPSSGDHVERDQHNLAGCVTGYWSALSGRLPDAQSALSRLISDGEREENNFAKRNATVCRALLSATLAVHTPRVNVARARAKVAALDTLLLSERVPPHVMLEIGTLVAARLHAALGDTALALVAARRREHLTGDPLFLAAQLRAEAEYATAMGDAAGAARAAARLRSMEAVKR